MESIQEATSQLTERDIKYIKALKVLGVKYVAQDKNEVVYGYITNNKPIKFATAWEVLIGTPVINITYLKIPFGVSWDDAESLDLNELNI
jgi:hypothetical protein